MRKSGRRPAPMGARRRPLFWGGAPGPRPAPGPPGRRQKWPTVPRHEMICGHVVVPSPTFPDIPGKSHRRAITMAIGVRRRPLFQKSGRRYHDMIAGPPARPARLDIDDVGHFFFRGAPKKWPTVSTYDRKQKWPTLSHHERFVTMYRGRRPLFPTFLKKVGDVARI